ncbi:MAG: cobalamin-dependent protein [Roseovarius sp.]
MEEHIKHHGSGLEETQKPAIRFLVESALRKVLAGGSVNEPRGRDEWILHLCEALVSESDTAHQAAVAQLMANGISSEELLQDFIPAAARLLGELWVDDKASFVDVTVGAARLQALFRTQNQAGSGRALDRAIPLGKSVLMVVPEFEQHSLGAFVAADEMRRKGLWVHMGIGLDQRELAELIGGTRFSMIGLSLATWKSVEMVAEIVNYLRAELEAVPPLVVGGVAVEDKKKVVEESGVDHAVTTVGEALAVCGLQQVSEPAGSKQGA